MSDSTEHQNRQGRRGSLLDHAGDAPSHARPTAAGAGPEAAARTASSWPAAPVRNARLSTSRLANPAVPETKHPAASAPAELASPQAKPRSSRPGREKFGDRIARLIGTIAPDPPHSGTQAAAEAAQTAPRLEADHLSATPQDPSWRELRAPRHPGGQDDHYHWHAASVAGGYDDGSRPLLDASILISAVWRFRKLIGAATVAGAVLGVMVALSTPHKYYAESRLFVDPREIRVTEDDARNQQLSTEAVLAITDSQLQILSSTSVLEKVIADLGLDRDPEFNGSLGLGGISAGWQQIKQIFSGKGGPSEEEQKALDYLRDAVSVARDAKTFVIIVGVDTLDPDKSALIANQIVETYLDSEGQAQSSLLERTSESIDTRINSLRSDLDLAEREVERFKAENGLVGVGGQYIDDKVILALSDQLANARAMKVGIRVKADNLAKVNIDDVLSGAFPEELLSSNLTDLRKQYTLTKSTAESLATQLGPRHPQYIAALSSLETITREISAELRRIVASSQTELQRAVQTEQELASQMAVAKSRAMDQSVEFVTLRELERKAAATRGIYEAFLTRSRETSERSNLSTRNVRVISPAEAPLRPMGPSRKFIAAGGMVAGFLAGVGVALLAGAVESFAAYNSGQQQARFQTPPFGGYPGPHSPSPHTPPNGPGRRTWQRHGEYTSGLDAAADQATAEPHQAAGIRTAARHSEAVPDRDLPAWRHAAASGLAPRAQSADDLAPAAMAPRPAPAQHQPVEFQPAPARAGPGRGQHRSGASDLERAHWFPTGRQSILDAARDDTPSVQAGSVPAHSFPSAPASSDPLMHQSVRHAGSRAPNPGYAAAASIVSGSADPGHAGRAQAPGQRQPQARPAASVSPDQTGSSAAAGFDPSAHRNTASPQPAPNHTYSGYFNSGYANSGYTYPVQAVHSRSPAQPPADTDPDARALSRPQLQTGSQADAAACASQAQADVSVPQQAQMPPAHPAGPARPDNEAALNRIRREMDVLRSRIDGYGVGRRSA